MRQGLFGLKNNMRQGCCGSEETTSRGFVASVVIVVSISPTLIPMYMLRQELPDSPSPLPYAVPADVKNRWLCTDGVAGCSRDRTAATQRNARGYSDRGERCMHVMLRKDPPPPPSLRTLCCRMK